MSCTTADLKSKSGQRTTHKIVKYNTEYVKIQREHYIYKMIIHHL